MILILGKKNEASLKISEEFKENVKNTLATCLKSVCKQLIWKREELNVLNNTSTVHITWNKITPQ